jgi:hypothetical protein
MRSGSARPCCPPTTPTKPHVGRVLAARGVRCGSGGNNPPRADLRRQRKRGGQKRRPGKDASPSRHCRKDCVRRFRAPTGLADYGRATSYPAIRHWTARRIFLFIRCPRVATLWVWSPRFPYRLRPSDSAEIRASFGASLGALKFGWVITRVSDYFPRSGTSWHWLH